jgi:hypothetical protein
MGELVEQILVLVVAEDHIQTPTPQQQLAPVVPVFV